MSATSQPLPVARPAYCRHCGCAIWRQVLPYWIETDTGRVTSAAEELGHRMWGRITYQAHRTGDTFELVTRYPENMTGDYTHKIVLVDHRCTHLPTTSHPHYWPRPEKETGNALPDY